MNRIALITGGARRLGKAFALSAARMGYDIFLHYHSSKDQALETKREIESTGMSAWLLQADLTDADGIESIFSNLDACLHAAGNNAPKSRGLSLLVNSAAIMPAGRPGDLEMQTWDAALDLNLRAPFLLAKQAARRMTSGGLIVNITDIGAQKAWSRYPAYTVSKAGLESLTKLLARAFAPAVRVNAIAPGLVLPSEAVTREQWDKLIERLPMKRPATLDEITLALEFLIKNEYITGQTIVVDGGYSLI